MNALKKLLEVGLLIKVYSSFSEEAFLCKKETSEPSINWLGEPGISGY
jgi:hypothetical protein